MSIAFRASLRTQAIYFVYLYPLLTGRIEGTTTGAALMSASEVINSTYPRACGIIRQGVPSQLMGTIYHEALNAVSKVHCVEMTSGKIMRSCFLQAFKEDTHSPNTFLSKKLVSTLAEDAARAKKNKYFPSFVPFASMPGGMSKLQRSIIATEQVQTIQFFEGVVKKVQKSKIQDTTEHFLPHFPSDEVLRYSPGRTRACEKYASMMSQKSLTLSAAALTAYMLGIVEQIILSNGDRDCAKRLLDEHIEIVYTAAECKRIKGEQLQIPTTFLDSVIIRAYMAVLKAKITRAATIVRTFPKLTEVRALIAGSRDLFGDIIDRLEGLGSLGRSVYLSWDDTKLKAQNLHDILGNETNIPMFKHFYRGKVASAREKCNEGYTRFARLDLTNDDGESCCSDKCMRSKGNVIDIAIMNEMCCFWCNQLMCDIKMRAEVIALQTYRLQNRKFFFGREL